MTESKDALNSCDVTKNRPNGIREDYSLKQINVHLPDINYELKFYKRLEYRESTKAVTYDIVVIPKHYRKNMAKLDRKLTKESTLACCPMDNKTGILKARGYQTVSSHFNFWCPDEE